jgi:C1A family cysteine protease
MRFLILFWIATLFSISKSSDLFENWCQRYGKTYSSDQEKLYRLKVFEDNYQYITRHDNSSCILSLNAFADLTHQEFKASRLGLSTAGVQRKKNGGSLSTEGLTAVTEIPASLDWRKKGAVTHVKNQGSCGACWSFSATGAIEGINQIVTGSLLSLSEQELIDCDHSYNSGCEGGLMDYAYQFIVKNKGIDTEDDYPYHGQDKSCNKNKLKKHVVTIDGYNDIPENNEKMLLQAVATQPVSVGISGSDRSFQLYSKGIFNGPCSTSLDHAVLIVGYGSENGVDYWIVKNSWGTNWGIDGYMHMARNTGNKQGVCGINTLASYPIKTSPNPPAPPAPTKCDFLTTCSAGETCCCSRSFLGFCFSWKCCEVGSAVCCKDHTHCCPHAYPVCDTKNNLCLKRTGNDTLVKQIEKKGALGGWSSLLEGWILLR